MKKLTRNGTEGRVYGGDPDLIHIVDGMRAEMGQWLARALGQKMRHDALVRGDISVSNEDWQKPLCPGCYMVVIFNASLTLARESGQPFSELGLTMSEAFAALATCAEDDAACIEEIAVKLDGGGL